MPAPGRGVVSPYQFKHGRFSSHTLMLSSVPVRGESRRVLDIGGGEGYLADRLLQRGYDVLCVAKPGTRSPGFPSAARLVESDLDFARPVLAEPFDYALCGDVLEHLRDPLEVLRWARRTLRPDGRLVASLPNGVHAYVRLQVLLGRFPKHDRGLFDRTHLHFFDWDGWRALLAGAGFELVTVRGTSIPFSFVLGDSFARLANALEWLSFCGAAAWKRLLAYQFVVVARPVVD